FDGHEGDDPRGTRPEGQEGERTRPADLGRVDRTECEGGHARGDAHRPREVESAGCTGGRWDGPPDDEKDGNTEGNRRPEDRPPTECLGEHATGEDADEASGGGDGTPDPQCPCAFGGGGVDEQNQG